MSDHDHASRSRVSPIIPRDNTPHEPMPAELDSIVNQLVDRVRAMAWAWARRHLGHAGLVLLGGFSGALTMRQADTGDVADVPDHRPREASSPPPPDPGQDQARAAEECAQCREDSRLAISVCAMQAEACGLDPQSIPTPPLVPIRFERPTEQPK